jgi:hypothetical protein
MQIDIFNAAIDIFDVSTVRHNAILLPHTRHP